MNNKNDNELNFDFDTPIENFIIKGNDSEEDLFDLAAYAASAEKKNSKVKRNRLNEEMALDKSIQREQSRFDANKQKHSAANAETRTAPHAITADELMRSRRPKPIQNQTPVVDKNTSSEMPPIVFEEKSIEENGYSSAAQLIFEKMRNRKNNESEAAEEISENVPDLTEFPEQTVENSGDDIAPEFYEMEEAELDSYDFSDKSDIIFNYDSKSDEDDRVNFVFNHDLVTEGETEDERLDYDNIDSDKLTSADDEISDGFFDGIFDNLDENDAEEYDSDSSDFKTYEEVQAVADMSSNESDVEYSDELFYDDSRSADFDEQLSIDTFENESEDDGLPLDFENTEFSDLIDEEADDIGFDLLESADELYEFEEAEDELLGELAGKKHNKASSEYTEFVDMDDESYVRTNLIKEKKVNLINFSVSAIASIVCAALCAELTPVNPLSPLFWIIVSVLNIAVLAVNFDNLKLIRDAVVYQDCKIELLPTVAAGLSLVQSVLGIFGITVYEPYFVFAVITSAIFAFTALAKYIRTSDIFKNFELVCCDDEKEIVSFIEQPESNKIMDAEQGIGYRISIRKKAKEIQNFVYYSTSDGPYSEFASKVAVVGLACSVIMAAIFTLIEKNAAYTIAGLCAGFCIAAPVSSLIMNIIAIRRANSALKRNDVVLPGFLSAKNIDNTNVICVEDNDLFGSDNIKLYNIKAFGGLALDKAIIDASALLTAANSPMRGMFNDISHGETIPETDSINYEEKMGISGWVGGRKTLIGNRMIMETHGISVPSIDIDKKIIMNGYFPVYLASEGVLSALFIVGYNVDQNISYCLKQIFNSGLTLLVKTSDPNITEEMIADYFGIHRDSVKIMSRESEILINRVKTADNATLLCKDTNGYLNGILSSIKLCKFSWYSALAQLIIIAVAFMIFGIASATGSIGFLNVISLAIYNILSILVVYIFHSKYF